MAPVNDPSWDIWGCSMGNSGHTGKDVLTRVTTWFEIHSIADMLSMENRETTLKYYGWLKQQTFPIIMQEKNQLVPQAEAYPIEMMLEKYGKNWWTSTFCYMMAYAIYKEYREIAVFGADMVDDEEFYSGQRDSMTRWIEIASAQGIRVIIPWESSLGKHRPLYGYDEATPFGRRMSVLKFITQKQRDECVVQRNKLENDIVFLDGALSQLKYLLRIWADGSDAMQYLNISKLKAEGDDEFGRS